MIHFITRDYFDNHTEHNSLKSILNSNIFSNGRVLLAKFNEKIDAFLTYVDLFNLLAYFSQGGI